MTLEERYELSCYEEIACLHPKKEVCLVKNIESGLICVKKKTYIFNENVYTQLQKLQIPNIPKIYHCVKDKDALIIVEDYIHGKSLQVIYDEKGVFQEKEILTYMVSLCDILIKLHEANPTIVHRDIKPSNIMLSSDNVIKLIDFNAAKQYSDGQKRDTVLLGTEEYAAPEQYGFGQSDKRTDIYGMGITMNYLLTGKYPGEMLYRGFCKDIIMKCISIDPNDRYHGIEELKKDILKILFLFEKQEQVKKHDEKTNIESEKSIFTRKLYQTRQKWIVGFRTGVLWKMIFAVYGYSFILWMSLTAKISDGNGVPYEGTILWLNRITVFLWLMASVFLIGNYRGIRYQLPLMDKGKILHIIMVFVYIFLIACMLIMPLAIIEDLMI